jgi:very-short-patch-repair endonuclease
MKQYNKQLKHNARTLRSNMTDVEQLLWSRLRRKQLLNTQFYRQKPLANFIVDFYCAAANLVIELDGSQHYSEEGKIADQHRDALLNNMGLSVLRFNNLQVLNELEAVMNVIYQAVSNPPNPPFPKGG